MTQFLGYGNNYGGGSGINLRMIIGIAVILFGVISYYSHESVNPTTGERQHVSMTADDEIALGLQSAPQMAAEMGGEVPSGEPAAQEGCAYRTKDCRAFRRGQKPVSISISSAERYANGECVCATGRAGVYHDGTV